MEQNIPQGAGEETSNQEQPRNEGQPQSSTTSNTNNMKAETKNILSQLETMLDEYMVTKAPFALPLGLKEFIATISPYLIIIAVIFALPLIFLALGLSTALAPFAMMGGYGYGWGFNGIVTLVVTVTVLVMEAMAVPGLFKRTKASWRLLFYVSVVSLIGSILSINSIVSGVISAIIGWYILFQMKDMYKN